MELFLFDPAILLSIFFVDELDSEDRVLLSFRSRLLDTIDLSAPSSQHDRWFMDKLTYHAYAPEPIVLDTRRKFTWVGSGASCECGTPAMLPPGPETAPSALLPRQRSDDQTADFRLGDRFRHRWSRGVEEVAFGTRIDWLRGTSIVVLLRRPNKPEDRQHQIDASPPATSSHEHAEVAT